MKQHLAFLIAAHTDVEQLKRLMDALLPLGDCFLHIDKKVKDISFLKELEIYRETHCDKVFLVKRVGVTWGGFSQCAAQRELLKAVFDSDREYDRVFFLSGLDYPVFSKTEMEDFLNQHKKTEFVAGWNLSESNVKNQLYKVKYYHYFRDIQLPHESVIRRMIIIGVRCFLRLLRLEKKSYLAINGGGYKCVYFGTQWTSMTSGCARHVLEEMNNNVALMKYFKTAYAPDELLIPTIVYNSHFVNNAVPNVKGLDFQLLTPLHYLKYEDYVWSWDEKAYNDIVKSGKMFVRKLVSGKSERLIEMLEERKMKIDKGLK